VQFAAHDVPLQCDPHKSVEHPMAAAPSKITKNNKTYGNRMFLQILLKGFIFTQTIQKKKPVFIKKAPNMMQTI
jgi:hypothetical protein